GNQDEQQFLFDPEIERTFRKLKKQTKASFQLNFEEIEENMAAENDNAQRRTDVRISFKQTRTRDTPTSESDQ
ncbi:hypothetical protein PIB30_092785, partial [Stylosanthes scabra]|nr:hypothetical protein [Stylosanthes scabra]